MALDKLNSLQFLLFALARFEQFDGIDGVDVDRVPFELRDRLIKWKFLQPERDHYFFVHDDKMIVNQKGWDHFIRWVGLVLDDGLANNKFVEESKLTRYVRKNQPRQEF